MNDAMSEQLQRGTSLSGMFPSALAYNEFRAADGFVRPHQAALHEFMAATSLTELKQVRARVRHRINEQEVTFNILGVPEGTNRPWQLDSLPYVVDPAEWAQLSQGLSQRARVLSAIFADLMGPQTLIRRGILPPRLVLGNPRFARSCHGLQPVAGSRLHLYAVDLGRGVDGNYFVHSDRAAAPTGSGYALENRLVLGRTLSELFNGYGVERVRGFFDSVKACVAELGPAGSFDPKVVVLSAGPQDESSFEHAYLARYLGYELVEGRDLSVRDRVVYLKTLSGLRRVDVILRRIDDMLCDPLSLREDSVWGVPGLVEAVRAGNVGVVNPLGSGLVEAPVFKAYLPKVCRELLGEELQLGSVNTLWLGAPDALQRVLGRLNSYVIKPAFSDRREGPIRPAELSLSQVEQLTSKLKANPHRFIAEEWPELSVAPVFSQGRVRYGHVAMRSFLCRVGDDYQVMPGGLARVDAEPDGLFLDLEGPVASKDIWVPSLAATHHMPPPAMPDEDVDLRRGGLDLPSRLLDDIYWLGRYVERCELTARVLRAGFDRLNSEAGAEGRVALTALLNALGALEVIATVNAHAAGDAQVEGFFWSALADREHASSLRTVCHRVHSLTLRVRSRLSRDAWHVLRRLTQPFKRLTEPNVADAIDVLDELIVTLSAVSGTILDNMVRGHAWMFLDMGRRVERGNLTYTLMHSLLPPGTTRVHMEALLEVADSLLTYRARYLSSLRIAPVVDLVLTDDSNPRSIAFQVDQLASHVRELPRLGSVVRSRAERRIIELRSSLLTADIPLACAGDGDGLRQLIEDGSNLLWQFSDQLTETWFSHATSSHALSPPRGINEELEPGDGEA